MGVVHPTGKNAHPLRALYAQLHRNSVSIHGPEVRRLADAAADCDVAVAVGVNERNSEASDSTLYNTLLYLGHDGRVLGKHQLIPTAGERLVWGQAQAVTWRCSIFHSSRRWTALLGELHAACPLCAHGVGRRFT